MCERTVNHIYYDPCFFVFFLAMIFFLGWSFYGFSLTSRVNEYSSVCSNDSERSLLDITVTMNYIVVFYILGGLLLFTVGECCRSCG